MQCRGAILSLGRCKPTPAMQRRSGLNGRTPPCARGGPTRPCDLCPHISEPHERISERGRIQSKSPETDATSPSPSAKTRGRLEEDRPNAGPGLQRQGHDPGVERRNAGLPVPLLLRSILPASGMLDAKRLRKRRCHGIDVGFLDVAFRHSAGAGLAGFIIRYFRAGAPIRVQESANRYATARTLTVNPRPQCHPCALSRDERDSLEGQRE